MLSVNGGGPATCSQYGARRVPYTTPIRRAVKSMHCAGAPARGVADLALVALAAPVADGPAGGP